MVASAGTTNGDVMKRLVARRTLPFDVVEAPDLPAAYDMLAAGKVAAFAPDDIPLSGMNDRDAGGRATVQRGRRIPVVRALRDHAAT